MEACMRRVVPALLLLIAAIGLDSIGHAQTAEPRHPDFSGTWMLVPSAGSDPQLPAMLGPLGAESVITQDSTELRLTQSGQMVSLRLDGAETRYTTRGNGGEWTYLAQPRWITAALLITTKTQSPIGSWEDALVMSFADDDTLAVTTVKTPKSARGRQPQMSSQQWVYRRK
jgi:hypothetical protein